MRAYIITYMSDISLAQNKPLKVEWMSYLLIGLAQAIACLPLPLTHLLGGGLGYLMYIFSPRWRQYMRSHAELAGYRGFVFLWKASAESGKMALELPSIWFANLERIRRWVHRVDGWEWVEQARENGRAIIFLTPHLGGFEIMPRVYHLWGGRTITILYRTPRKSWLLPLLGKGRRHPGLVLAPTDTRGIRLLLRSLHDGEAIGLLPDQVPRQGEGVWAPFWGENAYTMNLVQRLFHCRKDNSPQIIIAFAKRLSWGRGYTIHLKPLSVPLDHDPVKAAGQINLAIEEAISQLPTQYLWGYNRYRSPV